MTTIPQLADALQTVLGDEANRAGTQTGMVQRSDAKMTGSIFTQMLVFGLGANPHASLSGLAATAAALGVTISTSGLHQRFTEEAARCLEQVLSVAVRQVIATDPVVLPLLDRFPEVVVQDSTVISLPAYFVSYWRGCGHADGTNTAALKVQLALDLRTGRLRGPRLFDGRESDRNDTLETDLPPGSVRIVDLGYWDLFALAAMAERGVYWFSRAHATTKLQTEDGTWWDLLPLLQQHAVGTSFDQWVRVGKDAQVRARLIAIPVPKEVAEERRRRLREEARDAGDPEPTLRLALADWAIYITTIPETLLRTEEAVLLGAARWQIELIFKLWKSHGQIDLIQDHTPWRVLCELYGRLLAQIVQHWITLISCWDDPARSLVKAAQTLRQHWIALATQFGWHDALVRTLTTIARCIRATSKMNSRRKRPNTYQRFLQATASCPG
jgi:hypothetical protein